MPVARYLHDYEHVSMLLITVIRDATRGVMPLDCGERTQIWDKANKGIVNTKLMLH